MRPQHEASLGVRFGLRQRARGRSHFVEEPQLGSCERFPASVERASPHTPLQGLQQRLKHLHPASFGRSEGAAPNLDSTRDRALRTRFVRSPLDGRGDWTESSPEVTGPLDFRSQPKGTRIRFPRPSAT